jgi:hypothetical protein
VVQWLALKTTNTEVPGSIPGHSLGFFWGSWVWNGVHSASWSEKLSSYLNKEVTVRFGKLNMQLWDSMCWPHVNPVPSGAVEKDCQRRLPSRPRFVRACSATESSAEVWTGVVSACWLIDWLIDWLINQSWHLRDDIKWVWDVDHWSYRWGETSQDRAHQRTYCLSPA